MSSNAQGAIDRFGMLSDGERVTVGVSGGADSMALLHFLLFNCRQKPQITVCHVNHCLRGAESDSDAEFVEKMCKQWGVEFKLLTVDVKKLAKEKGLSVEEAARNARYKFFESEAKGSRIATAHTLSDAAETLIFNITRGTSMSGLCSIPPVRGNIIRPLITSRREDVVKYCKANKIPYVTDSSNLTDDYTRNKIRHRVVPVLSDINPAFEKAAGRLIDFALADEDYFSQKTSRIIFASQWEGGYLTEVLAGEHPAVAMRAISRILEQNKLSRCADRVKEIYQLILKGRGRINLSGDIFAVVRGKKLYIESIKKAEYFETEISVKDVLSGQEKAEVPEGENLTISVMGIDEYKNIKKIYKMLLYYAADYDKITDKIIIRQKKDGDFMRISGMRKPLKKLFNEKKLSAYEKSALPVIADAQGVIGVFGMFSDDRVKIRENTKRVLLIKSE